jgi:hypothetical protein
VGEAELLEQVLVQDREVCVPADVVSDWELRARWVASYLLLYLPRDFTWSDLQTYAESEEIVHPIFRLVLTSDDTLLKKAFKTSVYDIR